MTPAARPGSAWPPRAAISRERAPRRARRGARATTARAGGAWVFDTEAAGDGTLLFGDNGSKARIPASNQKLFTTAAFLSELGAEGAGSRPGPSRSASSAGATTRPSTGDLVLVGDGDPAFGTGRFARANDQPVTRVSELAGEIAEPGIKRVKGRVLADDTIFDRERRAGPYLSPLSGLSFNNGYDGGDYARAPELVAAKGLKGALRKRGVRVAGKVGRANLSDRRARARAAGRGRLADRRGADRGDERALEQLLRRDAAQAPRRQRRQAGDPASRQQQGRGVRGVGRTTVQSVDGSGLSRKNRVSPEQVGEAADGDGREDTGAAAFRDSLPVAGREGTVADRMEGTAAEGNCQTKTGTLSDVSALSGYCEAGGHTIAFSLLMNSANVDAARSAQDRMAAAIARYQP